MSDKKVIRVIKKNDLKRVEKPAQKTGARDTARDMVKTVTNWVNELQQKRREETAQAIKTLLPNNPRPSEA
jgi:flagellar hook-basal body complex protein FliE